MVRDRLRLRITMPSSVFCSAERGSRFIEPTTSRRWSSTRALTCRLARESGREPSSRRWMRPWAGISNSSTPRCSSCLRQRAYPTWARGASLEASELVSTRTRTPWRRRVLKTSIIRGPGTK